MLHLLIPRILVIPRNYLYLEFWLSIKYNCKQQFIAKNMSKTISTRIENNLHDRFLNICNLEGITISEILRDQVLQVTEAVEEFHKDQNKQKEISS